MFATACGPRWQELNLALSLTSPCTHSPRLPAERCPNLPERWHHPPTPLRPPCAPSRDVSTPAPQHSEHALSCWQCTPGPAGPTLCARTWSRVTPPNVLSPQHALTAFQWVGLHSVEGQWG